MNKKKIEKKNENKDQIHGGEMPAIKVGLINLVIMTGGHLSVFLQRDSSY